MTAIDSQPVLRLKARLTSVRVQAADRSGYPGEIILHTEVTEAIASLVREVGSDCVVGLVITDKPSVDPF